MGKLTRNEWGTFQMLTFIHFRHEHFPGLINIFNFNLISSHNFTFSTCRQIFYIRIYLGQTTNIEMYVESFYSTLFINKIVEQ